MNKKICGIVNCEELVRCKGLCQKHYNSHCYYKNPQKSKNYDRSPERRYKRFLATCKREGIPTDLTKDEWLAIIKDNKCHYCPNTLPETGSSLDRKWPDIGYFKGNVVPCCTDCNRTKGDRFSDIEFKVMMRALLEFRKQHGI